MPNFLRITGHASSTSPYFYGLNENHRPSLEWFENWSFIMELIQQPVSDNPGQIQPPANGGPAPLKNNSPHLPEPESGTPGQERRRLSLDGVWRFQFDPSDMAELKDLLEWREAHVPMPWQAEFEDLREQAGTGWYQRTFEL